MHFFIVERNANLVPSLCMLCTGNAMVNRDENYLFILGCPM